MKTIVRIGLIAVALAVFANTAPAQDAAQPVWTSPAGFQGLLISGDFATGLNDDAKFSTSSPLAFGGSVGYGASMFNVRATAMYVDTKRDDLKKPISFGGQVGVTVFQPAESPLAVNVFGGVGYTSYKTDTDPSATFNKNLNVPFGVGIGFSPPTSGNIGFEVWAAPRGQYNSNDLTDAGLDKVNFFGFGVSGGVNVNFNMGFGIHALIDWSTFSEKTVDGTVYESFSPMYVGAGLHYNFKMPGAGM
jgi:hypothetical protein